MRLRNSLAAAAVAAALFLAACGGDDSSSSGTTLPADLEVVAPGGLKWEQKDYSIAKSGDITFALVNEDQMSHSLIIEDADGKKVGDFRLLAAGGRTKSGTINLPPGQYRIVCDIPGHEAAGMWANLTVG
jgi:uncharacterized cupredoxin-like copper-binding protein